ncbi:hypothetical protein DAMA08_037120 [Martiniozyma asiatica (nom. inval.)]|nr:hypothetical protein DAMA08_037120 [Martiniozyma asiatica]
MPKDVTRRENVVKYVHIPVKQKNQASNFLVQNLPLVAMFLKNKAIAWACLFLSFQTYLNEPYIKDPQDESQPAIFRVLFSLVAVGTAYLDLIFPTMSPAVQRIAKEAKDAADVIAEN